SLARRAGRDAVRDARGMAQTVDREHDPPRTSCAPRQARDLARASALGSAAAAERARAHPFAGAERVAQSDRLFGAHAERLGAAAGSLRLTGDSSYRRWARARDARVAFPGAPARADHAGSRKLLGARLCRR